jgi:uncharacterized Zn finger protein
MNERNRPDAPDAPDALDRSERSGGSRPEWWDSAGPLPVEGGIKARSRRGAIGEQWWSRRFLSVLESFGMQGRLTRGRHYARRGQVVEFALSTGVVSAQVQGSRPRPYRVRIQVLPLTKPQWRQVETALTERALYRAKLLAGEMPAEIEDVFAGCGTPLFPRRSGDLEMSCSCPDWEVPCKHLAATCYVLAEAFDDDPFLMLAWRGRNREDLLASLRRITGSAGEPVPAAGVLGDVEAPPLADCLGSFWAPDASPARLRALAAAPAAPPAAPDLLLRTFQPPPVRVRRRDLVTLLTPAYRRLAGERGEQRLAGENGG